MSQAAKVYLRPIDVQTEFGWSVSTLEKWRSNGEGPAYSKCGRSILYERRDVVKWIEANKVLTN